MLDQTRIIADLIDAFPRSPIGANTPSIYLRELSEIPPLALERAVRHLIRTRTEPWLPTVGDVLRVVAEQTLALPDEEEALSQIDRRIEWGRSQRGEPPPVHARVQEALELVGGYAALRTADRPGAVRGSLLRHYRAIRARAIAQGSQ